MQINRSVSFLNHLIVIQQMQHDAAYDLAKHLKHLHKCASALEIFYSNCTDVNKRIGNECSFAQSHHGTVKCVWQKKQLFYGMYAMLLEESLLVRTSESTHLNNCQSVRAIAHRLLAFIEKFIPVIQKSKELLDNYLLGPSGAITVMTGTFHHYVISKQIEGLVVQNFKVINEFEEELSALRKQYLDKNFNIETLLGHFDDLLNKRRSLKMLPTLAPLERVFLPLMSLLAQSKSVYPVSMLNQIDVFESKPESQVWLTLMEAIRDPYAVERMSEQLLHQLSIENVSDDEAYWVLWLLFHRSIGQQTSIRSMFVDKFLLWKVFPVCCLRWILQFSVLERAPNSDSFTKYHETRGLLDTVQRQLAVWSKR